MRRAGEVHAAGIVASIWFGIASPGAADSPPPAFEPAAAFRLGTNALEPAPSVPGFSIGLGLHGSHLDAAGESADAHPGTVLVEEGGGGLNLQVGWGFDSSFVLLLDLAGAAHETNDTSVEFSYSSLTLEGRYLFRPAHEWRPFVAGGIGGMVARARTGDLDFQTSGPGLTFGGGFAWFVGDRVSLDAGARVDVINWKDERARRTADGETSTVSEPIEKEGLAGRLGVGVTWWL